MDVEELDAGRAGEVAEALAGRFADLYGGPPHGVFAAPGRVNLIGEHVDYNEGRCLPLALPHATYAALAPREDRRVRITSLQQDEPFEGSVGSVGPGKVKGWAAYPAGVLWALREAGYDVPGVDVVVDSRVPVGAGLSSSAAIECSVAVGVTDLLGVELTDEVRRRLVDACIRAETEVAGAPTGGMDQMASLFGRSGHALLLDCRDWSLEQVAWDPAAAGLALLVVDTRASHQLADGGYAARRADCERAAEILGVTSLREVQDPIAALGHIRDNQVHRRARHVLSEMARVEHAVAAIRAGDLAGLGRCMDASHTSLRDDFEVSTPELDAVVEGSRAAGAVGARMTGGGFGGSAVALLPRDRVAAAERAVAEEFDRQGWNAPGVLLAEPSDGARRVT